MRRELYQRILIQKSYVGFSFNLNDCKFLLDCAFSVRNISNDLGTKTQVDSKKMRFYILQSLPNVKRLDDSSVETVDHSG